MKKTSVTIVAFLTLLSLGGCSLIKGNKVPVYVAARTEAYAQQMRDKSHEYWTTKIKERRVQFEKDLDSFVVLSLRQADLENVLDADGVYYLGATETRLREEFDQNESGSVADLQAYLKPYDDIIILQREVIKSELKRDAAAAEALRQVTQEISDFTRQMLTDAPKRRQKLAGIVKGHPVLPATGDPVIVPESR